MGRLFFAHALFRVLRTRALRGGGPKARVALLPDGVAVEGV